MSKKIVIVAKKPITENTIETNSIENVSEQTITDIASSISPSSGNTSEDEHSHLPSVSDIYKGKDLRSHIYTLPDTYIGGIVPEERKMWVYNSTEQKMENVKVNFISGLYKIYDEILVNALDQDTRIMENIKYLESMKAGLAPPSKKVPNTQMVFRIMKNLKADINEETNTISIMNDGDGIDVAMHPEEGVYIPEFILGNLLTGGNYGEDGDEPDKKMGKIVGGKNGYGAKLTNIFSTSFMVETVDANRKLKYKQTFRNNMLDKEAPVIEKYNGYPYTKITFTPDLARFKLDKLDEDTIKIMKRRVYDASACVSSNVNVYFNGEKLNLKFPKYVNLYIGELSAIKRVSDTPNERWSITACVSQDHNFTQVSFVNGIATMRGGKHVDYVADTIAKKLTDHFNNKNAKKHGFVQLKKKDIKNNLWIFVKAIIEDPAFDTQTKEFLTTKISDFGSKCPISDEFISKLAKTGIEERAMALSKFKESQLAVSTTPSNRKTRPNIAKLDDAAKAGTEESEKCVLIITEGDSAKTLAVSGLRAFSEEKRQYFGIYPARGKILNVRDKDPEKVKKNDIIKDLKEILGLKAGMDLTSSISNLRYGEIWVFTDADVDGDHIKGLLFNFLHKEWITLLQRNTSVKAIISPIVRVWKNKKKGKREIIDESTIIEFYSESDYEKWKEDRKQDGTYNKYNYKYYKGLATYDAQNAVTLFNNLKIVNYIWDTETIDMPIQNGKDKMLQKINKSEYAISLAFNKKLTDDRKTWLLNYNPSIEHDMIMKDETYYEFVMNKFIRYSYDDVSRSIASICDGLKEGQRKIMFGAMKRNLIKDIRVAQLGGYVSEHTGYHHGEASLYTTIIGLAQNYVGSNNINLLVPSGQFGSRLGGNGINSSGPGKDSGAPRYIFTRMTELTRVIFDPRDDPLYHYLDDDGNKIEPVWYLPIIPLILINGVDGIGTGWSTNIAAHNPLDCIANLERLMDGQPLVRMIPWYRGYKGEIKPHGSRFVSTGVYNQISKDQLEITEIPIGHSKNTLSYNSYEIYIRSIADGSINKIESKGTEKGEKKKMVDKSVKHLLTDKIKDVNVVKDVVSIRVTITFYPGVLKKLLENIDELENALKLKVFISPDNMHGFNHLGQITKYNNAEEILTEFYNMRVLFYAKRKEILLADLDKELQLKSAKAQFIRDIHDENITINESVNGKNKPRKKADIVKDLRNRNYPLIYNTQPKKKKTTDDDTTNDMPDTDNKSEQPNDTGSELQSNAETGAETDTTTTTNTHDDITDKNEKGYQYLLSMRIDSLTDEVLAKLEKERDICIENLENLKKKTPISLWKDDLANFKSLYNELMDEWYEEIKITKSDDANNKLVKKPIAYHQKKPKKTTTITKKTTTITKKTPKKVIKAIKKNTSDINSNSTEPSELSTETSINDTEFGLTLNDTASVAESTI